MSETNDMNLGKEISNLKEEYVSFLLKILSYFPLNLESIKKFLLGDYTRDFYNKDLLISIKDYFKAFLTYITSQVIGFWWMILLIISVFILFSSFIFTLLSIFISVFSIDGLLLVGLILAIVIIFIIAFFIFTILFTILVFAIKVIILKLILKFRNIEVKFNEVANLILYSIILQMLFFIPILLSYSIFVGFFLSPIIYAIGFYIYYFIYKELVDKFKADKNTALISILALFIGEILIPFFIALIFLILHLLSLISAFSFM